ncbi:hypothetical protein SAMN05216390_1292 [Lachnospiraceae bacterium KH1T2]|nr:hypothetical protein SAMN05216390_1292 [Lachnospiraceae bacterium KH1T2]
MDIISTKFSLTNPDGFIIRGYELHSENSSGKLPAVIISHGFTSSIEETTPYGNIIAAEGYRAFVYDFCGGGFNSLSEGSFEDYMTTLTEKGDLESVLEYVRSRDDVDTDQIAIMGCSQGGFVSTLAAPEVSDKIKALMLIYPALCIPDDARRGSMQVLNFDPQNIPDHVGTSPMRICRDYIKTVLDIDIYDVLKKYHKSVFIIHGTSDKIVPVEYAQKAFSVLQDNGNDVEMHLIENGPHGFFDKYFAEAANHIIAYLNKVFTR